MVKRLIASDYDGTLFRNGQISEADREAIHAWQGAGGFFGIVTGRGITFPQRIASQGITCDFFVLYNGALLMDKNSNILHSSKMPYRMFIDLRNACASYAAMLPANSISFETDKEGGEDFYQYHALLSSPELAAAFAEKLNQQFPGQINALANGLNINVVKYGESKANGVRHALEAFGLPEEAAAVVGDDLNDLDMIIALDGWAMSSSRPEVLAKANHTCESIADLVNQLMTSGFLL